MYRGSDSLHADAAACRAQELGVACHCPESSWSSTYAAATSAIGSTWSSWRGGGNGSAGSSSGRQQTAAGTAKEQQQGQQQEAGEDAGACLRQRWRQHRALALMPLGSAAAAGSRAAAACAADGRQLLDAMSGKRTAWDAAAITYECMDGVFATCELATEGGEGPDGVKVEAAGGTRRPALRQAALDMRRTWMGSCPPSGSMWKRVKIRHAPEELM
jgi:hypothetical protein